MAVIHPNERDRFKKIDDAYGWKHVAAIYSSIFILCALSFVIWQYAHPLLVAFVMPFLGAQIYKITIIMHDCCHSSLFQNRTTNWVVGVVSGFFVGTMFAGFCRAHWKHHETFGEDDDPQGDDYLHLDDASRSGLTWHLLRPLLGYNLRKLLSFGQADTVAVSDRLRVTTKDKLVFLAGTFVVQILILLTATGGLTVLWLALLYPACAATFALFFSQIRGFAEHVALPGVSPRHHARTHLPNRLDKLFFYTLNFNYHIEHHRFPSLPSVHLPEIHKRMREQENYGDLSPSVLGTIKERLLASEGGGN